MTASIFIATSLDGFIARPDDALDWLPANGGEEHGYNEFVATVPDRRAQGIRRSPARGRSDAEETGFPQAPGTDSVDHPPGARDVFNQEEKT